jgi:hypothetical protein
VTIGKIDSSAPAQASATNSWQLTMPWLANSALGWLDETSVTFKVFLTAYRFRVEQDWPQP